MSHYNKLKDKRDGISTNYLVQVIKHKGSLDSPNRNLTLSEQNSIRFLNNYAKQHNYHFDIRKSNIMVNGEDTLIFTDPFITYKRELNEHK